MLFLSPIVSYNRIHADFAFKGASCNHGQSMKDVKESIPKQTPKEKEAVNKPETKVIKFNDQGTATSKPGLARSGLPGGSLRGAGTTSSFAFSKEKVGAPVPHQSLLEIAAPVPIRKREVAVYVYDNPKATGSSICTLKVNGNLS